MRGCQPGESGGTASAAGARSSVVLPNKTGMLVKGCNHCGWKGTAVRASAPNPCGPGHHLDVAKSRGYATPGVSHEAPGCDVICGPSAPVHHASHCWIPSFCRGWECHKVGEGRHWVGILRCRKGRCESMARDGYRCMLTVSRQGPGRYVESRCL